MYVDQCNTISISQGKIDFRVDINNYYAPPLFSNSLVNTDNWLFVCCKKTGNTFKVFVNGVLEGTNIDNQSTNAATSNLHIGHHGAWNKYFQGALDDIRVYNRELSEQEITSIYNENICYQSITVTDTLIINANLTGFNPITYQNSIKIYPNPTSDHITIDFGGNYSTMNGYTLKITNSLSQIVYTTPINTQSTTVDLSTWSGNGIYFVHLIDAQSNTIDIRKIVLQ